MPCDTRPNLTIPERMEQQKAVKRLEEMLNSGRVAVAIGANGALAFNGWLEQDRAGLSDVCAYRKLAASNSPQLRRAIARAEVTSGRKLSVTQMARGVHSHDGGTTWHPGH